MQMKRYNKMAIVCKSEETEHLQCHIDHKNTGNDRNDPPQSAGKSQGFSDSSAQSSCHRIGNDPGLTVDAKHSPDPDDFCPVQWFSTFANNGSYSFSPFISREIPPLTGEMIDSSIMIGWQPPPG